MTDAPRVDVAIIGCGTTGLMLARLLEMEGLSVAAVDRSRIPIGYPRATHLDDETMRAFQTIGLEHLEQEISPAGTYTHYDADWNVVNHFVWALDVTEQNWRSDYQFHQPDWEAINRGYTHENPTTQTYYGWTIVGLEDSGDEVAVTVRETSTSEEKVFSAGFVVGSDGANSPVRKLIGASQIDHKATHRSLIVDILPVVDKEVDTAAFIRGGIRNPFTYLSTALPRMRFEEMLRPDDDSAVFERSEYAYEMIAPYLAPHEYRILRSDVYEWRSLTADPWRVGRVFLAGDAAHTMPPHLGQGMCSGIRDATNLAWKLGRVIRGESPLELLDTYESERKPHVTTYTELAAHLANEIEAMAETPSEAPAEGEMPVTEVETLRPRLGPGIRAEDADAAAGQLSAQPKLEGGGLMDNSIGYRFAVVGDPAVTGAVGAETRTLLASLGVEVLDQYPDEVRSWLERLETAAVLIRPDRYVYGSAANTSELDALVGRLDAALKAPVSAS